MAFRNFLAVVAALTVAACSLPAMNQEVDTLAKGFFTSVASGADLNNDPRLSPELRNNNANAALAGARRAIPQGQPTRIENRGQNYNTNNGNARADLRQLYVYPQGNLNVETVLVKPNGAPNWMIAGFHVQREGAWANESLPQPAPVQPAPAPAETAPADGGAKP